MRVEREEREGGRKEGRKGWRDRNEGRTEDGTEGRQEDVKWKKGKKKSLWRKI